MDKTNEEIQKQAHGLRKVLHHLYPAYMYENVESIPYNMIEENNIKLIILDMDNTLIDNNKIFTNSLRKWAKDMKDRDVELYILSNSVFGEKVKSIAQKLEMKYKYNASKPSRKGFREIVKETNIPKEQILMVGDQLFTDIWGGNRFGIKTVLVSPIAKNEAFVSKIKRPLEKIILKHYLKKIGRIK